MDGDSAWSLKITTKNHDKKPPTKNKTEQWAMTGQEDPYKYKEEFKKVAFEDLRKKWQGIAQISISKKLEEGKNVRKLRENFEKGEKNNKTSVITEKKSGKVVTIGEMFTRMERRKATSKMSIQEGWRSSGKKRQREEDDGREKELELERKGKCSNFENENTGGDAKSQEIKRIKLQLVKPALTRPGTKRPIE